MTALRAWIAAGSALVLAGCASSGASQAGRASGTAARTAGGAITVYAASSLTEAFTTLRSQFERGHPGVSVKIIYGASSDLATQLGNGAPADVFASASPKNMAAVKSAIAPVDFVSNFAEIATPPSNPAKIGSVQDLARRNVKVAVCAVAVPCGALASTVLANAHVTVHPVANEQNVKATLAVVEAGEVDAGLVYVTDVRAAGAKVHGVQIPASVNASTNYPIAALRTSKNLTTAKAFVAYVRSAAGRRVLTADGFRPPA